MPSVAAQKRRNRREQSLVDLAVHMANSIGLNGHQITFKMQNERIRRAPHPAYPPDLSPCDFWFVGFLQEKLKEQELSTRAQMMKASPVFWVAIT
jgi:hypothetical protein